MRTSARTSSHNDVVRRRRVRQASYSECHGYDLGRGALDDRRQRELAGLYRSAPR
jgi:hypothetical protein